MTTIDVSSVDQARSTLDRRRLLGGAAGGFVLAASGLLVPGAVEAERQHPAERLLNDPNESRERNRKNRNRKNRHRNNNGNNNNGNNNNGNNNGNGKGKGGNDNDNDQDDNDQGSWGLLDVELNFYSGYTLTHEIEVWKGDATCVSRDGQSLSCPAIDAPKGIEYFFLTWPRQAVPPVRQLVKFTGQSDWLVLVDFSPATGPVYFSVYNQAIGAPILTVQQGTWSLRGSVNAGQKYFDQGVDVGQRVEVPGFYIDRSTDSPTHKVFYINAYN